MDRVDANQLVLDLSAGFDALQDAYGKLYSQHQALEKKLATAREQYNELAKLYDANQTTTPPLSLSPLLAQQASGLDASASVAEILRRNAEHGAHEVADKVKTAAAAADYLRRGLPAASDQGVKIWSGPSADKPDTSSCLMPSISESPLEQDFTIEGKPSKLGCPFASMHRKKLSSHAASVLSRYNHTGSTGAASTPLSTVSRVNGKESLSRKSSARGSFVDPIKAEICGLSNHNASSPAIAIDIPRPVEDDKQGNAEAGVCPIRFLDQHSPEEVATYFEKHKHELPRSHEVCVMRYQSNEDQIKELDAKYGNLVSMIQGLGAKHKGMLPKEPEDMDELDDTALSDEKVRKWARSVSAQAPAATFDDHDSEAMENREDERQPHFDRPLKDIRVGESPSRPWGISVPAKYLEKARSDTSSKPVQVASPSLDEQRRQQQQQQQTDAAPQKQALPAARCPFSHSAGAMKPPGHGEAPAPPKAPPQTFTAKPEANKNTALEAHAETEAAAQPSSSGNKAAFLDDTKKLSSLSGMVFTGPVFIGYSPEDAAKILRDTGFSKHAGF